MCTRMLKSRVPAMVVKVGRMAGVLELTKGSFMNTKEITWKVDKFKRVYFSTDRRLYMGSR